MFFMKSVIKSTLFLFMIAVPLSSFNVLAGGKPPGGTGVGDGDGISGYASSDDGKIVREKCAHHIDTIYQNVINEGVKPSDDIVKYLGGCLSATRSQYKHRSPYMRNNSFCGMLDIASSEACRGQWGLFGINHESCRSRFIDSVGRRKIWIDTFGYCNKSCPSLNPPDINTYPQDLPPCALKEGPFGTELIP